jgi:hypothetical protein
VSVSPTVDVQKAQMDLLLTGYDPLTRIYNGVGSATSNDTQTTIDATINFNGWNANPKLYFDTGLAKVGSNAVNKALSKLSANTTGLTWFAQVKQDMDRYIIINAGSKAGLKKGDVLTVHNQVYYWENDGAPCSVPLSYMTDQRPGTPTAIITLDDVEPDFSVSAVDPERPTQEVAHPGAIVRLQSFAPAPEAK